MHAALMCSTSLKRVLRNEASMGPWQQPAQAALTLAAARCLCERPCRLRDSGSLPQQINRLPAIDPNLSWTGSSGINAHACVLACRGGTGCWIPSTARAASWACGSTRSAWACWMLGKRAPLCSAP